MRTLLRIFLLAVSLLVAAESHADALKVKLGATLPLSGRVGYAGEEARRGIELAAEDFNSDSVVFDLVFEDNQHDAKQAAASAHKLINIDKVDVLMSMWDMADIVAPLAERAKIPHLAIRWDPQVAEDYAYTFTAESTYQSYMKSLLELLKSLGVKDVGLLVEQGKGWVLAGEYLERSAAAAGVKVVGLERYGGDELDFRPIITRLLKKKPEMLVLLSNPPYTQRLIAKIREISPKQRFTGYFEALQEPGLVEGMPFVAQFEVADGFAVKFMNRFGNAPKSRAAQAYDIVNLLALSVEATRNKPTPASIVDALRSRPELSGAAGPLFLTGKRSIESKCVWKVARGNTFVIYR